MADSRIFAAYRYFAVSAEQISFFDIAQEKRASVVRNFFDKIHSESKLTFELNKRFLLVFNQKIGEYFYIIKFSNEQLKTLHKEKEHDIEDAIESDFPFVYLIFDTKRQIVLVEIKTTVFPKIEQAKKKLERCLQVYFKPQGFEIILKEIVDEKSFWNYANSGREIYEISLTLNSPNLFGGFIETSKMLKEIKGIYNNLTTTLRISNETTHLTGITEENAELSHAVEYVEAGGGEWKMRIQAPENSSKKIVYHSRNYIRKVTLKAIETDGSPALTKEISDVMKSIDTILPEQE